MAEAWRRYLRFWRADIEDDVDEEIRFHVEMRERDYVAAGLSPEEAHAETLRRVGDVADARTACYRIGHERERRMRVAEFFASVRNDLVFAARQLARSRGFAAVVVLTLGIAIGACSAIFSVVDGVLLRPLPYADSDRLALVWEADRFSGTTREDASVPDYYDLRDQNHSFASVAAFEEQPLTLTSAGTAPVRLTAGTVSWNLLHVLGVSPRLGRGFTSAEDAPAGNRVAMLSERLWQTRFGSDTSVLGKVIHLNDDAYTVVGVLPSGVTFPSEQTDLWVPLQQGPTTTPRYNHTIKVIGRLRPGVTMSGAQADVAAIAQHLETAYAANRGRGMLVESLPAAVFGAARPALLVLLGAVGLVLLVACANVANLLLARAVVRQREVAVRATLGAGAGRLARQFFIESLLLSLAAAAVGLVISVVGLRVLLAAAPPDLPRLGEVGTNVTVLGFTLAVAITISFAFGLVPTLVAFTQDLQQSLRAGAGRNGSANRQHRRLRDTLVIAELALAVVLVVGAGLLARSYWTLRHVDPGFSSDNVLRAALQLVPARYPQKLDDYPRWTRITNFYGELNQRIRAIPGVTSVGLTSSSPLDPGSTNSFVIEGRESEQERGQAEISTRFVSPGYFATIGVPLLQGRLLADRDGAAATPVAVINATASRRYFPHQNPLGQRLKFWGQWRTVVGIVGDERFQGIAEAAPAAVYTPLQQTPMAAITLLVRTKGDPARVAAAVQREVWRIDGEIPLFDVATMKQVLAGSIARQRFTMLLLAIFATVATVLALLGVYGVLSYTVAQRTGELGIRVALGARQEAIVRLVIRRGAMLVVAGVAVGLVASLAGSRLLAHLLFGIGATDLLTYVVASLSVAVVALGASYIPARRAAAIDPVIALRGEY